MLRLLGLNPTQSASCIGHCQIAAVLFPWTPSRAPLHFVKMPFPLHPLISKEISAVASHLLWLLPCVPACPALCLRLTEKIGGGGTRSLRMVASQGDTGAPIADGDAALMCLTALTNPSSGLSRRQCCMIPVEHG